MRRYKNYGIVRVKRIRRIWHILLVSQAPWTNLNLLLNESTARDVHVVMVFMLSAVGKEPMDRSFVKVDEECIALRLC